MTASDVLDALSGVNLSVIRALLPGRCLRWGVYDPESGDVLLVADHFSQLILFARGVLRGKGTW